MDNTEKYIILKNKMKEIQGDLIKLNENMEELRLSIKKTITIDNEVVGTQNIDSIKKSIDEVIVQISSDIV